MAEVVVVGAGLGGLASALRLAKLGHAVTLVERGSAVGGAMRPIRHEGFTWDAEATTLPAALRDLSRKSGRPLEREVDLVARPILREHRFLGSRTIRLPGGSSAAQIAAVDAALGEPLGRAWVEYAHSFADTWDVLRRHVLEHPYRPGTSSEADKLLRRGGTLHRLIERSLPDPRLGAVARYHAEAMGQDPRKVPAWWGVIDHLEHNFGSWGAPTGLGPVLDTLEARLTTRKVAVALGTTVLDVEVRNNTATGVLTSEGRIGADVVVVAVDPRGLPALAQHASRTSPAPALRTTLLGLRPGAATLTDETVLHGSPTLVVRPGGEAPDGHQAWTVTTFGPGGQDPIVALADRGIEIRHHLVVRRDLSPDEQVRRHGSSHGLLWDSARTFARALTTITPINGLYAAGACSTIAATTPFVALTGTQVAEAIGPA